MNALDPILAATRAEVQRRREARPVTRLDRREGGIRAFAAALRRPGLSLIAEHKRRSPSAGAIREELALEDVVGAYDRGGAAALSVLTEGPNFGGSLDDLHRARAASHLPILRKDFIVDGYQVHEALAAGADAILLIVAALSDAQLTQLHDLARQLGMAALVEIHDKGELDRALETGAELIGINNRDLTTLEVDVGRTFELRERIPARVTLVAESGFSHRRQLDQLEAAGVDAVLIGEALMRSPDVEAACRSLAAK
jgi:indole-3-glycerol phosphate synthase